MRQDPGINPEDLLKIKFNLPPKEFLLRINDIFKFQFEFADLKKKENHLLARVKELLLSKLATIDN